MAEAHSSTLNVVALVDREVADKVALCEGKEGAGGDDGEGVHHWKRADELFDDFIPEQCAFVGNLTAIEKERERES